LVGKVKDLNSLEKYGLSADEIAELKGIKRDGIEEVKKVRVSMLLQNQLLISRIF